MSEQKLFYNVPENVENLEIGAGCGAFGKKFIPNCLITEKERLKIEKNCTENFVNYYCDAHKTFLPPDRFKNIFACNPCGYSFENDETASIFLKEMSRIIVNKGKITILTHSTNPDSNPMKVKRFLEKNNLKIDNYTYTYEIKDIDPIYKEHDFYITSLKEKTRPNKQIEIYVHKP